MRAVTAKPKAAPETSPRSARSLGRTHASDPGHRKAPALTLTPGNDASAATPSTWLPTMTETPSDAYFVRRLRGPSPAAAPQSAPQSAPVARFRVGAENDASEREAHAAAASFAPGPSGPAAPPVTGPAAARSGRLGRAIGSAGTPLDAGLRTQMEGHFGADLGHVRVHTGPTASGLARSIDARAFTHDADIVFGSGYQAGANAVTAHELAHVVQQTAPSGLPNRLGLSPRDGAGLLQRDRGLSSLLPAGGMDVDLRTVDGSAATPPTRSGMDATIGFIPAKGAPNSNVIAFTQIARIVNLAGGDINPGTLPADRAPRGPLNSPIASNVPGVRTEDDARRGVEGGFSVDVVHRDPSTGATVPQGGALAPRYPTGPGRAAVVPGFKRSDNPADIRSTTMFDGPGATGGDMDFSFESVVLGEDTGITYGSVGWGFGLRAGHVVVERLDPPTAGASPTFAEALERHRDFYVHEPVTFYFAFDDAALDPAEEGKIGSFTDYLTRNPDIHMDVTGFADIAGGASAYNLDLSLRRADAVKAALIARGIPEEAIGAPAVTTAHVGPIAIGRGASTDATLNAGTGDQGGSAAVGADQSREANRWANRRVVLTFRRATPASP